MLGRIQIAQPKGLNYRRKKKGWAKVPYRNSPNPSYLFCYVVNYLLPNHHIHTRIWIWVMQSSNLENSFQQKDNSYNNLLSLTSWKDHEKSRLPYSNVQISDEPSVNGYHQNGSTALGARLRMFPFHPVHILHLCFLYLKAEQIHAFLDFATKIFEDFTIMKTCQFRFEFLFFREYNVWITEMIEYG